MVRTGLGKRLQEDPHREGATLTDGAPVRLSQGFSPKLRGISRCLVVCSDQRHPLKKCRWVTVIGDLGVCFYTLSSAGSKETKLIVVLRYDSMSGPEKTPTYVGVFSLYLPPYPPGPGMDFWTVGPSLPKNLCDCFGEYAKYPSYFRGAQPIDIHKNHKRFMAKSPLSPPMGM